MKIYEGIFEGPMEWQARINEDGATRPLPLRLDIANHSPDGFAWGYAGSGPAQLALAILCDAIGDQRARRLYQDFKFQRIAPLDGDQGWAITLAEVQAWASRHG